MTRFIGGLLLSILIVVVLPAYGIHYILNNLEITWINIFLLSGLSSFVVLMAVELGKWVRQLWDER